MKQELKKYKELLNQYILMLCEWQRSENTKLNFQDGYNSISNIRFCQCFSYQN